MVEQKIKFGFKVLCKREGKLVSMIQINEALTTYREGHWVFPRENCGPLTVLKSRKAARKLKNDMSNSHRLVIKKCLYVESEVGKVWQTCKTGTYVHTLRELEITNFHLLILGQTVLANKVLIF